MTNEKIKQIALACGFKLKEQPDGTMDLYPYVYEFARALIAEHQKSAWISVDDKLPENFTYCLVLVAELDVTMARPEFAEYVRLCNYYINRIKPTIFKDNRFGNEVDSRPVTHWMYLPNPPQEIEHE